jgi:hypothetical protein
MCVINKNRSDILGLPVEDRTAIRAFAEKRLARAETDHAREFWTSLVEACMPDDEFETAVKARVAAYDEAHGVPNSEVDRVAAG